jgi:hypothetical protein
MNPMETAPKDARILIFAEWQGEVSYWSKEPEWAVGRWYDPPGKWLQSPADRYELEAIEAVGWLPLPAPGWVIVPREPTEHMIAEGESAASFGIGKPTTEGAIKLVWEWMLKAAAK